MANQTAQEELLLDVRVAEASSLYKFYLIQEERSWEQLPYPVSDRLGVGRQHPATHQPHVHERAVFRVQGGFSDVCFGGDL